MYQCQLNFEMVCVTSVLDISQQHLNHANLLEQCLYVDFMISLPHEDGSKVKKILTLEVYFIVFVMTMC